MSGNLSSSTYTVDASKIHDHGKLHQTQVSSFEL